MEKFMRKHHDKITGSLSAPDRAIIKGSLPFRIPAAAEGFLYKNGKKLTDFKDFTK